MSYCSFTPSRNNLYILNGQITFDENNNGCDVHDINSQI